MIYSLVIQCSPSQSSLAKSSLEFAKAILVRQHQVYRIFFYGDGAWLANDFMVELQGEDNVAHEWRQFLAQHTIDAVVCITASLKRGLLDGHESLRYGKKASNLAPEFQLSGLGQFIEAAALSDRVITFG
jgi:tRNA 2-thiouridine synthesizing protein D